MNKKIQQHSVKYNFIMNFILTASNFIFPLITFPYVSRILLASGNGKVNFAASVANYFMMVASLGIPTYGIRACAKVRDDKEALSKTAQEILMALSLFLWDEPFLTVSEVLCPGPPQVPSALRASVLPGGPWEHRRGAHGLGTALSIRSSCTDFWMHP